MRPARIGVAGPVGSGKTALLDGLCKAMRERYRIAVITNDIYTYEDAEFLVRSGALPADRILGVQTGGCPHTAIREDPSINQEAVEEMLRRFPDLDLLFLESGGDNLAASFSPELVDVFHLRHRCGGRGQDPEEGRAGGHAQRPARDQQDRPGTSGGRGPPGDGARRACPARRPALRVHEPEDGRGS